MEMHDTATAHRAWQDRWTTDAGRAAWLTPETEVTSLVASLRGGAPRRALDLGCGVGRHALHLAGAGFTVCALDASDGGVAFARREAARRGVRVSFVLGAMTDLPYDDAQFDYVLAWNVIYHGDGEIVRRCLSEIHRVLRPGGAYQGTLLSKRNREFGRGRQVAPGTFVQDGGEGDKMHPHFFCDAGEAVQLFSGFDVPSLIDREQTRPGTYHWHVVAERRV